MLGVVCRGLVAIVLVPGNVCKIVGSLFVISYLHAVRRAMATVVAFLNVRCPQPQTSKLAKVGSPFGGGRTGVLLKFRRVVAQH